MRRVGGFYRGAKGGAEPKLCGCSVQPFSSASVISLKFLSCQKEM